MKNIFPNTELFMSDLMEQLVYDAAKLAKKTESRWVGVCHLFALMLYACCSPAVCNNKELSDLRKVLEEYNVDVYFRRRVCKQIFSETVESSLNDGKE